MNESGAFTPDFPAAVSGYAGKTVSTGVSGITSKAGSAGVLGYVIPGTTDSSSIGVHGLSQAGAAVVDMRQFVAVGPPTTGVFAAGEIVRGATPDLWICTVGGAQSKWRKLGGANTAGALHIIDPTRVYDSRIPSLGGPLASNTSRVINIANGIDLGSGAVRAPNVVPPGATAIQFTLTITEATTNGFLAVTPGDASQDKASTINWTATTPTAATGSLAKIAADRTVNVFAGGGGATHAVLLA